MTSSMGLTTIIPAETGTVTVEVFWCGYIEEKYEEPSKDGQPKLRYDYRRSARLSTGTQYLPLANAGSHQKYLAK